MDARSAKLALARKKLKDHQEKKLQPQLSEPPQTITPQDKIMEDIVIIESDVATNNVIASNNNNNLDHKTTQDIRNVPFGQQEANINNVNVTEMLISSKRNLEQQVNDLQRRLTELQENYNLAMNNNKQYCLKLQSSEKEINAFHDKYSDATKELASKDLIIQDLNTFKISLSDQNNNLVEQLEFMKTVLTAKEAENDSLHSQLYNLQNQLDTTQLQLQQLINGTSTQLSSNKNNEQSEALLHKISSLEQQIKSLQKERDSINVHYEHYVNELNGQLKTVIAKNEELSRQVYNLSNREESLIEQISDMEIRIQNFHKHKKAYETDTHTNTESNEMIALQQNNEKMQQSLQELSSRYNELNIKYIESVAKINQLSQLEEPECHHDNISVTQLNADIASDKIAAQRATEQNKKLKQDLQGLEEAFVKMSKDKLELTEKLTAEKYLSRELTLKLAEIEENAKNMEVKLKAKDDEMLRLQASYRDVRIPDRPVDTTDSNEHSSHCDHDHDHDHIIEHECAHDLGTPDMSEDTALIVKEGHTYTHCSHDNHDYNVNNNSNLPKEDAMIKLQERFLKIMGEVADLSDEKHRLEHIILQLQTETETICEYVALYQQQRSLLKKRDEERSAQIKIFQSECSRLKNHLDELTAILIKISEDKELLVYFQVESRHRDLQRIMGLLTDLKSNSLVDPQKKNAELKNFYPCSCCSGKLIDV